MLVDSSARSRVKGLTQGLILSLLSILSVLAIGARELRAAPRPMPIHKYSALRGPAEPARDAYRRYYARLSPQERAVGRGGPVDPTALSAAVPRAQLDLSKLVAWNLQTQPVLNAFKAMRDLRFLPDAAHGQRLRRSTWLYPDDGCFARAALFGQNVEKAGLPRPTKIFIFGNLSVKTANSPTGEVTWWYHVVPIVRMGQVPVVFDPAIDPSKPLHLDAWISTMIADPSQITLSVCHPQTYTPTSPCASGGSDASARSDQMGYLGYEWSRLQELGRDPERELVDFPPWAPVPGLAPHRFF